MNTLIRRTLILTEEILVTTGPAPSAPTVTTTAEPASAMRLRKAMPPSNVVPMFPPGSANASLGRWLGRTGSRP